MHDEEFDMLEFDQDYLEHYGTPRHSGRYPWGTGDNPYQPEKWFLSEYRRMKSDGLSDKEIADGFQMSIKEVRMRNSIYAEQERLDNIKRAQRLKKHGYPNAKIAEMMGLPPSGESTVRGWLKAAEENKKSQAQETADFLKKELESKKYLNVGAGVERELGISREKLDTAILIFHPGYKPELQHPYKLGYG